MTTNYRQIFARRRACEDRIRKACPGIPHRSGIYVFYRMDESQIRRGYIGQARDLCSRCASHLLEYDHIALSLKRHGFFFEGNPYGWKLVYKECPERDLNKNEVATIKSCADKGIQCYNLTTGSQGTGKKVDTYKTPKTYMQGVERGYIKASKEISHLFDLHLKVSKKSDRPNKNQDKALEKFQAFLDYHKLKEGSEENET